MEIGKIAMPAANALDRIAGAAFGATRETPGSVSGSDFAALIRQSLAHVGAAQAQAETAAHRGRPGQGDVPREDAMRSMQTADVALQTTVQIRDKLVAAYNDIMNMQL